MSRVRILTLRYLFQHHLRHNAMCHLFWFYNLTRVQLNMDDQYVIVIYPCV